MTRGVFSSIQHFLATMLIVMALGAPAAAQPHEDLWKIKTVTVAVMGDLTGLGQQKKLERGVVYVVQGDATTPENKKGIFYFLSSPLPSTVSAGEQTPLASGGFLFRPTSQTPEVRAEWFGAKGDGIRDDSLAIQAALDAFKRVDFEAKTYGIGKGLHLLSNSTGAKGIGQALWNKYFSLILRTDYKLLGAGKTKTKLRLLDNTNPRPDNSLYAIMGGSIVESAANVVIRDLHIDVNFDGQSKEQRAPDDVLVVDNVTYTRPNSVVVTTLPDGTEVYGPDVPTINAIHNFGPNLLAENLLVTGYSSNTENEAFVIFASLAMRDIHAPNTCATIRGVEMTNPGSNLGLKYRKKGGRLALQAARGYAHIAEITHIAVGGAINFFNHPYTIGGYGVPVDHGMWNKIVETPNLSDALGRSGLPTPGILKVLTPGTTYYRYDPQSTEGFNNLTSFALEGGILDVVPGRLFRLPALTTPPIIDLEFSTTEQMLAHFRGLPLAARPQATRLIKVRNVIGASPEYYAIYPTLSTTTYDDIEHFRGTGSNTNLYFHRILPKPLPGQCSGWNCDPAFDPSWSGENITNVWPCEGGVIENNYLHDEYQNPEAYDQNGVRYGIIQTEGVNASHLHGITTAATKGLVVRNNYFKKFQGLGVFIMSWWNEGLRVVNNTFDEVMNGVSLAAFVENEQKPLQWPRHRDARILNNYIRLMPYTVAPSGYFPSGFALADYSWGATYPNTLPLEQYPRFDTIEFAFNRVVGRADYHVNRSLGLQYPSGVSIRDTSFIRNLRIHDNLFDIEPNLGFQVRPGQRDTTATTIFPGQPYHDKNYARHDIYFYNNHDLKGVGPQDPAIDAAFRELSVMPPVNEIAGAPPVLINYSWTPYAYGDERAATTELPTATPTPRPTVTPTYTSTPTPSPKPTDTPTWTPTPQPTLTPTYTPTWTSTPNPTEAPTKTPTYTPTPQPTNTPTWTPTPEPTETPTPRPTETPTPGVTPGESANPVAPQPPSEQVPIADPALPKGGDLCPSDPNKRLPGACGCGVPDIDQNRNGVFDCKVGMEIQTEVSSIQKALVALHPPTSPTQEFTVKLEIGRITRQLADLISLGTSLKREHPTISSRVVQQLSRLYAKLRGVQRAPIRAGPFTRTRQSAVAAAKTVEASAATIRDR